MDVKIHMYKKRAEISHSGIRISVPTNSLFRFEWLTLSSGVFFQQDECFSCGASEINGMRDAERQCRLDEIDECSQRIRQR